MKNISIWKDTCDQVVYPELSKDIDTDVLIIGGGMTGASALYHLRNSKLNVTLIDQNRIGFAVTGNSTGKLSFLQNDLLDKIRSNFGDDVASEYISSQKEAIRSIVKVVKDETIDCDLEKTESYLYTDKEGEIAKIKDLENFLDKNNIKVEKSESDLVKSKYMIKVRGTYIFHPLKFVQGLIKNTKFAIYENTSILKIDEDTECYIAKTENYQIACKKIIISTHYPYFNMPFMFPLKGSLEKSYLSASKYITKPISLISYTYPFISIRNFRDYLIYLSNSHANNKDTDDEKNYLELMKKLDDKRMKSEYLWSNVDILTNDGLPYIGRLKDNVLMGTGYNTWGLTNGFLAGKILADIVMGKKNKYEKLFDPHRLNVAQIAGTVTDTIKNVGGYISGMNSKNSKVIYEKIDGEDVMTYRDGEKEYTVLQTCPHMGCKLIFNEVEKTWDCPCHASRFDITGKCISGPANKDITFKKK